MIFQKLTRLTTLLSLALTLAGGPSFAQPARTEVLWLGQSAFKITSPGGKVIITDPWLRLNPLTPPQYKNLEALGKVDLLLVTHGHLDHFADAPALAVLNRIPLFAPGDMNQSAALLGILPPEQLPRFNKGGTINPLPGIKVTAVHAEHSSVLVWKNAATGKDETHVGGEPLGFIIELENGFRIYHMGDSGLFGDMKFIAEYYKPDLVLIPIGGNFTMGPADAAFAIREWLKPKFVIPMHYGANPLGIGTPAELLQALGASSTSVLVLKPGEKAEF
ncbi:MAG: metal-dependent hydrolase [Comamonadaceae bacterium]|jgi:L-ascorbate metabolism protein UlaG (beta-lactamase superfamily)